MNPNKNMLFICSLNKSILFTIYLSSIDQFISQALSYGFDVAERRFSSPGTQQPNCLVHTSKGWHVNSLYQVEYKF